MPTVIQTLISTDTATAAFFTKTETLRRLRVAAKLIRANDWNVAKNSRLEVGTRVERNAYATAGEAFDANYFGPDNDLDDSASLVDSARYFEEVREQGYIANIYIYESGPEGFLYDVQNVWLGTDDHEPVLFDRKRGPIFASDVL